MRLASPSFTARPATLDDADEIAGLLHRVFGVRQTPASLRWKYTGCAGRLSGSAVLAIDRRIVGFLGQIPVRVRLAGRDLPAAQGADVGILEEHRRLDGFLALLRASVGELEAAGVALTYGTANVNAAFTLAALVGQHVVAPVPLLVRPLRGLFAPSLPRDDPRLIRFDRFDKRFDRFWLRIRDDYPVQLVRDAAYLNWRYVDPPGAVYERLGVVQAVSGEIEGYAVLGMALRGGRVRGRICDLVTPRLGGRRAADTLIGASLAWLRAQEAEVADVWMFPHAHLRVALRRRGFMPRRTGQGGFQACLLTPGAEAGFQGVDRGANWFLSMGDSDTV